jgi:hypothetical protein
MAWWAPLAIGAGAGALTAFTPERAQAEQRMLARRLKAAMDGTGGPSVAEEQLRGALRQSAAMQHGMAAGARPGQNAALARRTAAQQSSALQASAAGKAALLRAQEQAQARMEYANLVRAKMGMPSQAERFLGGVQGGLQLYSLINQQQQQQQAQQAPNMNLQGPPGANRGYPSRY